MAMMNMTEMFRTIVEKLEHVDKLTSTLLELKNSFQEFREDSVKLKNSFQEFREDSVDRFLALDEKVSGHRKPKAPKRVPVVQEPVEPDTKKASSQELSTEHGAVIHRAGQFYFQLKKEFLETIRKTITEALEYIWDHFSVTTRDAKGLYKIMMAKITEGDDEGRTKAVLDIMEKYHAMKHEGFELMDKHEIKHTMDAKTSTKTHFNETFTSMKKLEFSNGMHTHPFFDQFLKSFSKIVRERFDGRMVARDDGRVVARDDAVQESAPKSKKRNQRPRDEDSSTDDDDDDDDDVADLDVDLTRQVLETGHVEPAAKRPKVPERSTDDSEQPKRSDDPKHSSAMVDDSKRREAILKAIDPESDSDDDETSSPNIALKQMIEKTQRNVREVPPSKRQTGRS